MDIVRIRSSKEYSISISFGLSQAFNLLKIVDWESDNRLGEVLVGHFEVYSIDIDLVAAENIL